MRVYRIGSFKKSDEIRGTKTGGEFSADAIECLL
jgi:hypothetical protein